MASFKEELAKVSSLAPLSGGADPLQSGAFGAIKRIVKGRTVEDEEAERKTMPRNTLGNARSPLHRLDRFMSSVKTSADDPNSSSFLRHLGRTTATALGGAAGHLIGLPSGGAYGLATLPSTESAVGKLGPFQRNGGAIGAGLGAALANYMSSGSAGTISDALSAGLGAAAGSYAAHDDSLPGGYVGNVLGENNHLRAVRSGNHKDPQFWRSLGALGGGAAAGGILGDTANRIRRTMAEKKDEKEDKTAGYTTDDLESDLHAALHRGVASVGRDAVIDTIKDKLDVKPWNKVDNFAADIGTDLLSLHGAALLTGRPRLVNGHTTLTGLTGAAALHYLNPILHEKLDSHVPAPLRGGAVDATATLAGRGAVRAYDAGIIPNPLRPLAAYHGAEYGEQAGRFLAPTVGALARKILRLPESSKLPVSDSRLGGILGAAGGAALGDSLVASSTDDFRGRDALLTALGAGAGVASGKGGGKGALVGLGTAHLVNKATGGKKEKAPKKKTYREYSEE